MNELYEDLKDAFNTVQAEKNSPLGLNKTQLFLWELHTKGFNLSPDEAISIYEKLSGDKG